MLALIYLGLAICLGNRLCRQFYRFISVPHRLAAAFLIGILISSWFTYLAAWIFSSTAMPLLWSNLLFFAAAISTLIWTGKQPAPANGAPILPAGNLKSPPANTLYWLRPAGSDRMDWLFIGAYFVLACWLTFATLDSTGRKLHISSLFASALGPQLALVQSFAVGKNFPAEWPLFTGERIHYAFLFFLQAGNLEFLGLDPAWSINLLTVLSLVAMLALTMMLGEVLFNSRGVGRVGSALFFFSGSLGRFGQSLREPGSTENWQPYWLNVLVTQRSLIAGIGTLLLVLIFILLGYRAALTGRDNAVAAFGVTSELSRDTVPTIIVSGLLVGLLPMWNGAVFAAALAILGGLFIFLSVKKQILVLAATAGIVALPQLLYATANGVLPELHWLDLAAISLGLKNLGLTVGLEWLPIAMALVCAGRLQWRIFLASLSVLLVMFSSNVAPASGLNREIQPIWLVVVNLFVAFGLYRLWMLKRFVVAGRSAVIVFALLALSGTVMGLFPIQNASREEAALKNDALIDWVRTKTEDHAVFASNRFGTHPILMAGRRIFLGPRDFVQSAGYDVDKREDIYRQIFQSTDPAELFHILKENAISYVAYDDSLRHGDIASKANERTYAQHFQKIWQDVDRRYDNLIIYKLPDAAPISLAAAPAKPLNMFEGGRGSYPGQFDSPRGIAVDSAGNILIADTGNGRIQKFSADGKFIASFGERGWADGEFMDPFGTAVDGIGNIYVLDSGNARIQKFNPDGSFNAVWRGKYHELALYGPRKIAIGPDDSLYVADMGHARIIRYDLEGRQTAHWGTNGSEDGQFRNMTSVAVDPKEKKIYVADPTNKRIQIFDRNGVFLGKWPVEEWGTYWGFEDLAVDPETRLLYASSVTMDSVLVFDLNGNRLPSLQPSQPDKLDAPTAIALGNRKLYVLNNQSARVSVIDLAEERQ